ncbi:DUF1972 domain-containing protein [Dysgonomonas sp. OttesenSCG-928-M03]|nr:DUF1972 domain-containing protein [Dysgonomonas sp. OttesenSCG-928-M03]
MKIAILGTRGIPNSYGGFEQFAEYLSVGLSRLGHSVTVYNTSFHEYEGDNYKGVSISKIYSPEKIIGASANFIYDYLCLKDALKKDFDIIYELGYHSNAPSYYFLNEKSPVIITNMDGLEWKRSKWSPLTRKLIHKLEKIAINKSDYLISDNPAIRDYYLQNFEKDSFYIPYGAEVVKHFDEKTLVEYNVSAKNYFLIIARLEPENNIEMILDGFIQSQCSYPFLVIGNKDSKYGKYLQKKYTEKNILFLGGIYNKEVLDNLRHFSSAYFHGHSVGGTNPSLLEAMASQAFIIAHDNPFNHKVLGGDSIYFKQSEDISSIIKNEDYKFKNFHIAISNNLTKIEITYSWSKIISDYENLFLNILNTNDK